jgi:hypothetical protein
VTPQQFVGIAARLFAIWLVVLAFQAYGIASVMNRQFSENGASALYLLPALPILLAAFLWFFPMFVAHKVVPRTHDANVLRIPAREATAAASAIIGIWVLISALPHLFATLSVVFFGGGSHFLSLYFSQERTQQLLAVLLQSVLGVFLVAKPWFVASRVFPSRQAAASGTEF